MTPELKIHQLRYVLAIVDEGGFHAAARRLHRTQPALSLAIKDVEERLGQALFEKSGKALLTPFGDYCVARFRPLVAEHDRLSHELVQYADQRMGRVDMATVPSVASRLIPHLLAEFVKRYPGLRVSLHDGNADYVQRMVAAREVDLGMTSLWRNDGDFIFTPLIHDAVGVVCRDDHAFAGRASLVWRELKGQTLIRNGTSRLLPDAETEPLLAESAFYVSNMISLTAMLEAGIGITTLPRLAFPEEHRRLRFIPLVAPHVEREIGILKTASRCLSPAAQAMERFILESLEQPNGLTLGR